MGRLFSGMLLVICVSPLASAATPLDHLRATTGPRFRVGHTLPLLTRWGWRLSYDIQLELTEHWGYALEMGEVNASVVPQLDDPKSLPARLCSLTASDPKRYPLSVLAHRACCDRKFVAALPPETWCQDAEGKAIEPKTWSPEAPDAVFQRAAAAAAEPLKKVLEKAPIAIILNGGEYALSVSGHCAKVWQQDPKVMKAKGERDWFDYITERKAHQEMIITEAIRAACPDRLLYGYYYVEGCPHRGRHGGWKAWAWDYPPMRRVCDLPGSSIYYVHFNSGWTGDNDMLTQALNATAQHLAQGDALSYNWLNGGWTREKMGEKAFGDLARYTGYLKCYYTAGMLGGCAGYFAYPKGGFDGDVQPEPPHWLAQMTALGHVHALFSHLEEFLRKGDLLAGPDKHRWSKDLPAYEFPTGDPAARVVARKHRERDEWLVTAWAAGGDDRQVSATIPGLGAVTVEARACGSVYRAVIKDGQPSLTRVDENGMHPTAGP
ncbi:MAG TPA: hypothetical protein VNE39_07645 [Planctomycetota bacterium]|nr:hypothetical protein [Planctomycetota bacterium]